MTLAVSRIESRYLQTPSHPPLCFHPTYQSRLYNVTNQGRETECSAKQQYWPSLISMLITLTTYLHLYRRLLG